MRKSGIVKQFVLDLCILLVAAIFSPVTQRTAGTTKQELVSTTRLYWV